MFAYLFQFAYVFAYFLLTSGVLLTVLLDFKKTVNQTNCFQRYTVCTEKKDVITHGDLAHGFVPAHCSQRELSNRDLRVLNTLFKNSLFSKNCINCQHFEKRLFLNRAFNNPRQRLAIDKLELPKNAVDIIQKRLGNNRPWGYVLIRLQPLRAGSQAMFMSEQCILILEISK